MSFSKKYSIFERSFERCFRIYSKTVFPEHEQNEIVYDASVLQRTAYAHSARRIRIFEPDSSWEGLTLYSSFYKYWFCLLANTCMLLHLSSCFCIQNWSLRNLTGEFVLVCHCVLKAQFLRNKLQRVRHMMIRVQNNSDELKPT